MFDRLIARNILLILILSTLNACKTNEFPENKSTLSVSEISPIHLEKIKAHFKSKAQKKYVWTLALSKAVIIFDFLIERRRDYLTFEQIKKHLEKKGKVSGDLSIRNYLNDVSKILYPGKSNSYAYEVLGLNNVKIDYQKLKELGNSLELNTNTVQNSSDIPPTELGEINANLEQLFKNYFKAQTEDRLMQLLAMMEILSTKPFEIVYESELEAELNRKLGGASANIKQVLVLAKRILTKHKKNGNLIFQPMKEDRMRYNPHFFIYPNLMKESTDNNIYVMPSLIIYQNKPYILSLKPEEFFGLICKGTNNRTEVDYITGILGIKESTLVSYVNKLKNGLKAASFETVAESIQLTPDKKHLEIKLEKGKVEGCFPVVF